MKYYFTFDKTKKAKILKKSFLRRFKNYSPKKCDIIIVAGGDGFMLHSLKKFYKFKKPFYGVNCGTIGFLLNKVSINNFNKNIIRSKKININPLEIQSWNKNNIKHKNIAINEVSLFRQSKQTTSLKIDIGNKPLIDKLIGDGVLVSTPAGSTAYNYSAHGPILSLNSEKIAITSINAFRPRKWKSKIISNLLPINIKNLDYIKRPVAVTADNIEIRNIKKVKIKTNKKIKINLLYNKDQSLVKKINIEKMINKRIKAN